VHLGGHLDVAAPVDVRGGDHVAHQGGEPLRVAVAQDPADLPRQLGLLEQAAAHGVVEVVVHVGDDVRQAHDLGLQRQGLGAGPLHEHRPLPLGVAQDAVAHLGGEVQAAPVLLQHIHHPHRLLHVVEAALHDLVQHLLARVAEGGVAQVVAHDHGLHQHLVEPERLGDGSTHLGHLEGVGEPGAVVVALGREEDLGLALEPPEGLAVEQAVPVPLEDRPHVVLRLGPGAPAALRRTGGAGVEGGALQLLEHLADRSGHAVFYPDPDGFETRGPASRGPELPPGTAPSSSPGRSGPAEPELRCKPRPRPRPGPTAARADRCPGRPLPGPTAARPRAITRPDRPGRPTSGARRRGPGSPALPAR
jgi:hypothetical protein